MSIKPLVKNPKISLSVVGIVAVTAFAAGAIYFSHAPTVPTQNLKLSDSTSTSPRTVDPSTTSQVVPNTSTASPSDTESSSTNSSTAQSAPTNDAQTSGTTQSAPVTAVMVSLVPSSNPSDIGCLYNYSDGTTQTTEVPEQTTYETSSTGQSEAVSMATCALADAPAAQ